MVCAIVRSVSLSSSVKGGQVSTTWLMLWAAIEGVVGTCPAVPRRLSLSPSSPHPLPRRPQTRKTRRATHRADRSARSNNRRLPALLRRLHPRPRRGLARPLRPLPGPLLQQRARAAHAAAELAREVGGQARGRAARRDGAGRLGAGCREQEELGWRRDRGHAGVEAGVAAGDGGGS